MKIITDSRCTEYSQAGHPERPQRISRTVERLRQQKDVAITWSEPGSVDEAQLLRAHDPQHLERLKQMQDQIYRILSARSGKPLRQIIRDTKRTDYYLDAAKAKEYGLIDAILNDSAEVGRTVREASALDTRDEPPPETPQEPRREDHPSREDQPSAEHDL